MIITLIIISIFLISTICVLISKGTDWGDFFMCLLIMNFVLLVFLGAIIIKENALSNIHAEELQIKYDVLTYGMEKDPYFRDTTLINQIEEYNVDITKGRIWHQNMWTSWFYGDYYMEAELIDLK